MTSCPIPDDFWYELASSLPSFYYRDLEANPELVRRLKDVLERYNFRMVEVGEICSKGSWWFSPGSWKHQGPARVSSAYWLVVEPIQKGSYQP